MGNLQKFDIRFIIGEYKNMGPKDYFSLKGDVNSIALYLESKGIWKRKFGGIYTVTQETLIWINAEPVFKKNLILSQTKTVEVLRGIR